MQVNLSEFQLAITSFWDLSLCVINNLICIVIRRSLYLQTERALNKVKLNNSVNICKAEYALLLFSRNAAERIDWTTKWFLFFTRKLYEKVTLTGILLDSEARILRFHIDLISTRTIHCTYNYSNKRTMNKRSHDSQGVLLTWPAVTGNAILSVTLPLVDQIITWLPNSIWSTQPLHNNHWENWTQQLFIEKVHSSLIEILQPGLPSSVSSNCCRLSWTALSRYWLLSFSSNWNRILAWAIFGRLSHRNFTWDL